MDYRWTIVAEFRGTTSISQVSAPDVDAAVLKWVDQLRTRGPFGRASGYLARTVHRCAAEDYAVAIKDLEDVWVIDALCGDDLMLANFIRS